MKKLTALGVLLIAAASAAPVSAAGKEVVFSAPRDKVFAIALEAIASEWRLDNSDKETGVISFRSGMSMASWKGQDLSLLIVETEGGTKVMANSERRGKQAITWGEGGKLQKKAIRLIGERLLKAGLIPASEVPKK
jgi:hypothetical protein